MSTPVVTDAARGVRQLTITSTISIDVYLIETAEGVVAFDAGVRGAGAEILAAAEGSVAEVILSHAHVDHRAASELGAPIYCHPAEVDDAQGDGGQAHYADWNLIENRVISEAIPRLHTDWDGGPVSIAGTVEEGEEVASWPTRLEALRFSLATTPTLLPRFFSALQGASPYRRISARVAGWRWSTRPWLGRQTARASIRQRS